MNDKKFIRCLVDKFLKLTGEASANTVATALTKHSERFCKFPTKPNWSAINDLEYVDTCTFEDIINQELIIEFEELAKIQSATKEVTNNVIKHRLSIEEGLKIWTQEQIPILENCTRVFVGMYRTNDYIQYKSLIRRSDVTCEFKETHVKVRRHGNFKVVLVIVTKQGSKEKWIKIPVKRGKKQSLAYFSSIYKEHPELKAFTIPIEVSSEMPKEYYDYLCARYKGKTLKQIYDDWNAFRIKEHENIGNSREEYDTNRLDAWGKPIVIKVNGNTVFQPSPADTIAGIKHIWYCNTCEKEIKYRNVRPKQITTEKGVKKWIRIGPCSHELQRYTEEEKSLLSFGDHNDQVPISYRKNSKHEHARYEIDEETGSITRILIDESEDNALEVIDNQSDDSDNSDNPPDDTSDSEDN